MNGADMRNFRGCEVRSRRLSGDWFDPEIISIYKCLYEISRRLALAF
jgi:hypothetical protein